MNVTKFDEYLNPTKGPAPPTPSTGQPATAAPKGHAAYAAISSIAIFVLLCIGEQIFEMVVLIRYYCYIGKHLKLRECGGANAPIAGARGVSAPTTSLTSTPGPSGATPSPPMSAFPSSGGQQQPPPDQPFFPGATKGQNLGGAQSGHAPPIQSGKFGGGHPGRR